MSLSDRLRRAIRAESDDTSADGSGQRRKSERAPRAPAWAEAVPEPPPIPEGWHTGPPDFVVIGAQKAGTTWWFRLIASHPGVQQPEGQRPELHFFDRSFDVWPGRTDIQRYHRYFPRPEGALVGEKTPDYLGSYWVPRMLAQAAPDARVIALLRESIERYLSGTAHEARRVSSAGIEPGWFDARRATIDAYQIGLYAQQLRSLRREFRPEHVLVLQYEACVEDAAAALARTYAFLGLPPHELTDDELAMPRNRTPGTKPALEPDRRAVLVQAYEPDVLELATLVPELDLRLWPSFTHLATGPGGGPEPQPRSSTPEEAASPD